MCGCMDVKLVLEVEVEVVVVLEMEVVEVGGYMGEIGDEKTFICVY